MESHTYKCIPLLLKVTTEEDFLSNTAIAYESVLNEAARGGWKFVRIDTISTETPEYSYQSNNILTSEKTCTKVFIFRKQTKQLLKNNIEQKINITCPSCKNEISEDDIYCENCACKLK